MRLIEKVMSAVWKYFKICDGDKTKAECTLCAIKVSRGGAKPSSFNTSNLIKHLKNKHEAEYKAFIFVRYKDCFFSNANTAVEAKEMVRLELQKLSGGEADVEEPPARKQRKAQASSSSLDSVFAEIANEQASSSLRAAPVGGAIELETYLGEALSKQDDKPLQYWGVNKVRFPTLAKMSRKFLSAPCSSVGSERLFSSVSHIVDETRNRITPEHAEMLLFIKKNLPLTFLQEATEKA